MKIYQETPQLVKIRQKYQAVDVKLLQKRSFQVKWHEAVSLACPSVCRHQCSSHWTDFHKILYWGLQKYLPKNKDLVKSRSKKGGEHTKTSASFIVSGHIKF